MHHEMKGASATPGADRVVVLDSLRGFALWGVFVINSLLIARPPEGEVTDYPVTDALGRLVSWFVQALVVGKFYTLFAFLFGVSFAMLLARLDLRTGDGAPILRRRLLVLLAIGMLHSALIWNGDILKWYALAGFVLLALRRVAPAGQLRLALVLLAVFYLAYAAIAVVLAISKDPETAREAAEAVDPVFAAGTYQEVTAERLRILGSPAQAANLVSVALYILPVFLLGSWFGNLRLYRLAAETRAQFQRLMRWSGVLGIVTCCGFFFFGAYRGGVLGTAEGAAKAICMQLSNLGLGLFFASLFVLHAARKPSSRFLAALAPLGRMALTNYLLHSFLMTWLMYGHGGGLALRSPGIVGLVAGTSLFYVAMMVVCRLWLERFAFGPLEWAWRSFTYGRRPAFRKRSQAA